MELVTLQLQLVGQQMETMVFTLMVLGMDFHIKQVWIDSGGVLAFEGHEEDNVYQDVDVVDDGHLTQSQMNQGFTSTMGADVWFWNSLENTLTLKQTVTGADGSVSTQVREINDHDPNRNFN